MDTFYICTPAQEHCREREREREWEWKWKHETSERLYEKCTLYYRQLHYGKSTIKALNILNCVECAGRRERRKKCLETGSSMCSSSSPLCVCLTCHHYFHLYVWQQEKLLHFPLSLHFFNRLDAHHRSRLVLAHKDTLCNAVMCCALLFSVKWVIEASCLFLLRGR